ACTTAESRGRAKYAAALRKRELDSRVLVLASDRLCLAPWILGRRAAQLDLDTGSLRLDAQRVSLRARLLGSPNCQPRTSVRTGVLSSASLRSAELRLHALDQHCRVGRHG